MYAPVVEGAEAGCAYVLVKGNAVGKFPVVFGETVEKTETEEKGFWKKRFGGARDAGTTAENNFFPGGGLPAKS